MEINHKCCRLCLSEKDFNVSLHGDYCRRTNMADKIQVCLKITIDDRDPFDTICFKCADNVEKYYDFSMSIKKNQSRYPVYEPQRNLIRSPIARRFCSRAEQFDPECSFSFLEGSNNKNKRETKASSPFFSSPKVLVKQSCELELAWSKNKRSPKREGKYKTPYECERRNLSRDLFESQSQEPNLDWKWSPDDTLIERIKEKCFGWSDY